MVKLTTMTIQSNLYAEKIFSEHPLALWALDDDVANTAGQTIDNISIVGINSSQGIKASGYGTTNSPGYYLINSTLKATNSAFPMVYGSNNSTTILSNSTDPSLVVPAFGFLNKLGFNKTLCLEFWIRLNAQTTTPRRILGPIDTSNTDGLYVDGSFLKLKIGNNLGSYFVNKWYKPTLIQIQTFSNGAEVYLDGEKVISLNFVSSDIPWANYNNIDYIGFYSYSDIKLFEIDSIAIYDKLVNSVLSKLRYSYAQNVDYPHKNIEGNFGQSLMINYSDSNYAKNYIYPVNDSWSSGISSNIDISNNYLQAIAYDLPKIITNAPNTYDLVLDNSSIQTYSTSNYFIKLKPNNNWNDYYTYLDFSDIFRNTKIQACQLTFNLGSTSVAETLLLFKDKNTGDFYSISIDGSSNLIYSYSISGQTKQILKPLVVGSSSANSEILAGVDILKLIVSDSLLASFFSSFNLQIFVGGDDLGSTMFSGTISSITFFNKNDYYTVGNNFDSDGYANGISGFSVKYGSYTLLPQKNIDKFILDVAVNGYWQDSITTQKLSSSFKNTNGTYTNNLKFLQINLQIPKPLTVSQNNYDTSSLPIKTYVIFKKVSSTKTFGYEYTTVPCPITEVVEISSTDFDTNKYEVIDGCIIYPPSGLNIDDFVLVIYQEFNIKGISSYPAKNNKLEIISKTQNPNSTVQDYIYQRDGLYIAPFSENITDKNSYRITKHENPYLYMDNHSGIEWLETYNSNKNQGIVVYPDEAFDTNLIQLALKVSKFNQNILKLGSLVINVNSSGVISPVTGIKFYINGIETASPTIIQGKWFMLAITLADKQSINMSNPFKIIGNITFNNLCFFQPNNYKSLQTITYLTWSQTKGTTTPWSTYTSKNWQLVSQTASTTYFGINPLETYNIFVAQYATIVNSSSTLRFNNDVFSLYSDIKPVTLIYSPQ